MYAVVSDRGRQHCVEVGQLVRLDLLHRPEEDGAAEAEETNGDVDSKLPANLYAPGDSVELDRVLLVGGGESEPAIGRPVVEGAKVLVEVVRNFRDDKIIVQKYKRRKNYRKKRGHRQPYTEVKVQEIVAPS